MIVVVARPIAGRVLRPALTFLYYLAARTLFFKCSLAYTATTRPLLDANFIGAKCRGANPGDYSHKRSFIKPSANRYQKRARLKIETALIYSRLTIHDLRALCLCLPVELSSDYGKT
jgi:hypothetical protein